MEIAKFEKIKTWLPFKIVLAQGHVLGNANFDSRDDIHVFTLTRSFFLRFQKLAFCEERQCQDKFFFRPIFAKIDEITHADYI